MNWLARFWHWLWPPAPDWTEYSTVFREAGDTMLAKHQAECRELGIPEPDSHSPILLTMQRISAARARRVASGHDHAA